MNKKIGLLFLAILYLSACATYENYALKLDKQIGKTRQQLIAELGTPQQIEVLADKTTKITYIYKTEQTLPLNNIDYNIGFMDEDEMFNSFTYGGNIIPDGNLLEENITDICRTTYYLTNNIVTSYTFTGNACVSI